MKEISPEKLEFIGQKQAGKGWSKINLFCDTERSCHKRAILPEAIIL